MTSMFVGEVAYDGAIVTGIGERYVKGRPWIRREDFDLAASHGWHWTGNYGGPALEPRVLELIRYRPLPQFGAFE